MFATNMFVIYDTVLDLTGMVTGNTIATDETPSFEYVIQCQVNATYTSPVRIGNVLDTGLSANYGYLLSPGDVFRIKVPSPYRVGVISAVVGTPGYISTTMVEV